MDNTKFYQILYKNSMHNAVFIPNSKTAGCFACCAKFSIEAIKKTCDNGQTVLCPICGTDAVLLDAQNEVTDEILNTMHNIYFTVKEFT